MSKSDVATFSPIKIKTSLPMSVPAPKWVKRKLSLPTPAGSRKKVEITFAHKEDPKQLLLNKVGEIPDGFVQFSRILVAVYQPPQAEKTDGGIFLTSNMTAEDMEEFFWQGKVGLIVAMGDQAYVDDEATKFHGTKNRVGDWVWFRPSDGQSCEVNGVFCRIFREGDIIGRIPHPDAVW